MGYLPYYGRVVAPPQSSPYMAIISARAQILIAEDDENDQILIGRAFSKAGADASLLFAADGEQAIARLSDGDTPRLLLLDLKMPIVDGFQVLEWLLRNPHRRPPLVIVLSSSASPDDMERVRHLGADLFLTKPNNLSEYVAIAHDLMRRITTPAGDAPPNPPNHHQ